MDIKANIDLSGFEYPDCWKNKVKMQGLFSTFRPRNLNAEAENEYVSKMTFWKNLIGRYCEFTGKAIFTQQELQIQFMRGDQLPACLGTVITDMLQQKEIRARSEYEYDPQNTWRGWAINKFVKRPLLWGWSKIKQSNIVEDLEWVYLDVLGSQCNKLETHILEKNCGKILNFEALQNLCSCCLLNIHTESLVLCLLTLQARKKVGLHYKCENPTRSIHLIKIPATVNAGISFSEEDLGVHRLQMTQSSLLKELEKLEEDIRVNDQKVQLYVKEKKRQMAKTYLRKRHLMEKNHERRSIALHNIEELLSSVDEARNNGVVLDAYKIGAKALQKALTESGLKYDHVDEVLADVRDTMEQHKEVQHTISNGVSDVALVEDDDLDRELRELLGETTQIDFPSHTPTNEKPGITDSQLIEMLNGLDVEEGNLSDLIVGKQSLPSI
ncbi:charged multivesicular body protein 7 [Scaptodrosophila lebanonensis]|uniref:Charged multivesicular body protein 7 n=1 Tax=Drosophila lebanonensis TaxID=7225 RepID=A0A6J2U3P7_DROLE|nr:charged multivesicular body protein 7 [Scaptodrosophila lebanonensis]